MVIAKIPRFNPKCSAHPLYKTWYNMKSRCFNPNDKDYANWGGRGIRVCEEWTNNLAAFIKWAEESDWKPGLQVDRENNEGNYEPGNCRWASPKQQQRNRRNNAVLKFNGESRALSEWAEMQQMKPNTLWARINSGWSVELAISTPVLATRKEQSNSTRFNRYLEFNGERKTIAQWADFLVINVSTIYTRLARGWSVEKSLSKPHVLERGRSTGRFEKCL